MMHHSLKYLLILTFTLRLGFSFSQEKKENHLSREFHEGRREALRQKLPPNSVAVFFASPIRNRSNDVDFVYHQDPDFYYLTGYTEPHAVLLIFKETQTGKKGKKYSELIFIQPKDPYSEMWTGERLGVEGVQKKLGLESAFENSDFINFNIDFSKFNQVLFFDFKGDVRDTDDPSDLHDLIEQFKRKTGYPQEKNIDIKKEIKSKNLNTEALPLIMDDLRGVKTEEELQVLKKAIDISCIGQVEVMKAMKPGMSELEIQGIHEFVFKKYGAQHVGYPSIVGAGNNGCILHYIDNHKPHIDSKELVLMDIGAEYLGYTADVTRTIPANGKFSEEQKNIYDLVLKAQKSAINAVKPGTPFSGLEALARKVINDGLAELGIISDPNQMHMYFPHGLGHHLGLDVHDRGDYYELKEDMVITIEPGIYIPKGSPCPPKWWGIAVRIEDDILVTRDGATILSTKAPRTTEEIEKVMAESSPLEDFILPDLDN